MSKKVNKRWRQFKLFLSIVWRYDGSDPSNENHHMSLSTAWEVAKIIHG